MNSVSVTRSPRDSARSLAAIVPAACALAAALALLVLTWPAVASAATAESRRVIVEYSPGATASQRSAARARAGAHVVKALSRTRLQILEIPAGTDPATAAGRIASAVGVERARADHVVGRILTTSTDTYFANYQWPLVNTGQTIPDADDTPVAGTTGADIDAGTAWDSGTGGSALVAVLDTGVDYEHYDLLANMWKNAEETPGNGIDDDANGCIDDYDGYNATPPSSNCANPRDDHGHGTHVSGTIAADGANGDGVAGVNWQARIMPVKIANTAGEIWAAAELLGMQYAIDQGALIVNGSYGGPSSEPAIASFVSANPEVLFVFAAGNGGDDGVGDSNDAEPMYPCNIPHQNVICVASTNNRDVISNFSNRGPVNVDLAAPGEGVLSTLPPAANVLGGTADDLTFLSGTSMATPHVAGAASLLLGVHNQLTAAQLRAAMLGNVDRLPGLCGKVQTGGRLNLGAAVESVLSPEMHGPQGAECPGFSKPPSSGIAFDPAKDVTPPTVAIGRGRTVKLGRRGRVSISLQCTEACAVTASGRARVAGMPAIVRKLTLTAGETGDVVFSFRKKRLAQLQSLLRKQSRVKMFFSVVAVDAAANKTIESFAINLRR